MRGLDTNVLLRHVMGDDPAQSAVAQEVIDGAERRGERLLVTVPVLCELVWTLERSYRLTREQIGEVVATLLDSPVFVVDGRTPARLALLDFERGHAGFIDYLVGQIGHAQGCRTTLTFDEALLDHPHFETPGDLAP
jgi:predicted nucleic-acid-binding protein